MREATPVRTTARPIKETPERNTGTRQDARAPGRSQDGNSRELGRLKTQSTNARGGDAGLDGLGKVHAARE